MEIYCNRRVRASKVSGHLSFRLSLKILTATAFRMGMLRTFRSPILQLTQWSYPDQERLVAETADASTGLHSSPGSNIERQAAHQAQCAFLFLEFRMTKIRTTVSISKRLLPPKN